jgi:hypothetical protein
VGKILINIMFNSYSVKIKLSPFNTGTDMWWNISKDLKALLFKSNGSTSMSDVMCLPNHPLPSQSNAPPRSPPFHQYYLKVTFFYKEVKIYNYHNITVLKACKKCYTNDSVLMEQNIKIFFYLIMKVTKIWIYL